MATTEEEKTKIGFVLGVLRYVVKFWVTLTGV